MNRLNRDTIYDAIIPKQCYVGFKINLISSGLFIVGRLFGGVHANQNLPNHSLSIIISTQARKTTILPALVRESGVS